MQDVPESLWGVRPWRRCQYCSSAAERYSPARSPSSVVVQVTTAAVQNNAEHIGYLGTAWIVMDDSERFSQPPDLAVGRPRLALRPILLMSVDPCTSDVMQANMSLPTHSQ